MKAGGEEGSRLERRRRTSQLSSMLPQALPAVVMGAGGLGLAAELTRGLAGAGAGTPARSGPAPSTTPPRRAAPAHARASGGDSGTAETAVMSPRLAG